MRTLIIAEKPSVATDLARVLSKAPGMEKFTKDSSGAFYSNSDVVITSAVGHLLEQKKPMTAEGKPLPWKLDVLPCIPERFELAPIQKSEDRLKKILSLAKKNKFQIVVNACDAGREGELIFRNLIRYSGWKMEIRRLWMQSMTDDAILQAWQNMRTDEEMTSLADAAICRAESDWLIGLNSTRALTAIRSSPGGFNITPVGRVQTPTLAILAKREKEIQDFVSVPYYEVHAQFQIESCEYEGKWINPSWKKDSTNDQSKAERIWDLSDAQEIVARDKGKTGIVRDEQKTVNVIAPQLFDLTSLQREASNRFGFSAKRTLQLAQECYEKHKVLTYPRTDSRYLPEDYTGKVGEILEEISATKGALSGFARKVLKNKWIKKDKRIFNSAKISDHFAIIPTGKIENLGGDVLRLYELVLARFIAVFYPSAVYSDTKRYTEIFHENGEKDTFLTTGRILIEPGWREVYGAKAGASSKEQMGKANPGEIAQIKQIQVVADQTKPSARFNEATLLSAMEGAGKLVENEELAEAMRERGLGTPATRAAIIEGLIFDKYVERDGRDLITTARGLELIDQLRRINIEVLASPSLTGDWEFQLKQMESGKLNRNKFMHDIEGLTQDIVDHIKNYISTSLPDMEVDCPKCKAHGLAVTPLHIACKNAECKFSMRRFLSNREMSLEEAKQLIQQGEVGPLDGFKSRFGKAFSASLKLDEKFKPVFVFPDDGEHENAEAEVLTDEMKIGKITRGGEVIDVYLTERAYRVPTLTFPKEPNGLTVSKTILSREIPEDQFLKLVGEGKTDLLKGFVSQRTKRSFSAFLTLDAKTGKIGFEFEERVSKKSNSSAKTKSTKAKSSDSEVKESVGKTKPTKAKSAEPKVKESVAKTKSARTPRKKKEVE